MKKNRPYFSHQCIRVGTETQIEGNFQSNLAKYIIKSKTNHWWTCGLQPTGDKHWQSNLHHNPSSIQPICHRPEVAYNTHAATFYSWRLSWSHVAIPTAWITVYCGMKESVIGKKYLRQGILRDKSSSVLKPCGHMLDNRISFSAVYIFTVHFNRSEAEMQSATDRCFSWASLLSPSNQKDTINPTDIDCSMLLNIYLQFPSLNLPMPSENSEQ